MSPPDLVRHMDGVGSIRGEIEGDVVAFRAIPHAVPPLGSLRFLPPQAPTPWQGTRDATANGPIAPQTPLRVDAAMGSITAAQNEDCLTLNVWTPADGVENAPVMVWIHGGALSAVRARCLGMTADIWRHDTALSWSVSTIGWVRSAFA
jgi:carboxylesterase type B